VPFSGMSLVRGLASFVDKVASPLSVDAASEDDSDVDSEVDSDDVRGGDDSVTMTTSLALTTEVELTGNNDKKKISNHIQVLYLFCILI
jgi:hypothetical protein